MSNYINIGKISATQGLNGSLVVKHSLGKKTDFKNTEAVFIEVAKQTYLPFFPENSIIKSNAETIVKLESVNTKEDAAKLLQKKVWLTNNDFEKLVSKRAPVNLIGFIVMNNNNKLGEVEAVIEQPHQILLQINVNHKEVLIPVHENTLKKIDRKKKEVQVVLPEGLLEVYLGS